MEEGLLVNPENRDRYLSYLGPNYERGISESLWKIEEMFTDADGIVYWGMPNLKGGYYSTISLGLYMLSLQRLYMVD